MGKLTSGWRRSARADRSGAPTPDAVRGGVWTRTPLRPLRGTHLHTRAADRGRSRAGTRGAARYLLALLGRERIIRRWARTSALVAHGHRSEPCHRSLAESAPSGPLAGAG